jgi:radical SAM protein with 4Fe4S-binding SPASM domain
MDLAKEQNKELVKKFLERTFFKAWKEQYWLEDSKYSNYSSLELIINAICDQNCKYCYYAKNKEFLYPKKISDPRTIMNNLKMVLRWLEKNSYFPKFDLFSGEIFRQNIGFEITETVMDWLIKHKKRSDLVIPTNFSFILSEERTNLVEALIEKGKRNNVELFLSASVDGKYCDENRPFKNNSKRDDNYYDRLFSFCSKYGVSFHPMVYGEKIEQWIDNFVWFQEMFQKHNIPFDALYLLEVRNKDWSLKQIKEFYKFIRFVIRFCFEKSGVCAKDFPLYVFNNKLFNIFSCFGQTGRGVGCSIQAEVGLRLGDLHEAPCHRLSYNPFLTWKFIVEDNEIVDIEVLNPQMIFAIASLQINNLPFCENCLIKYLCSGQCLGSMYETTKDPFIPIPTVCLLEHAKLAAILDELKELNILHCFFEHLTEKKLLTIAHYFKYLSEEKK